MNDDVKGDFAELEATEGVRAVIVGDLGAAFGYDVLNAAFRQVMDRAELIALQKNRYWRTAEGLSLDVGAFVAALEYATGRDAFVAAVLSTSWVSSRRRPRWWAMTLESDVGGALAAGLPGVLVRTGKYGEEALRRSGIEPTAILDSIADLPALLGIGK